MEMNCFAIVNTPVMTVYGSEQRTRTDENGRVLFNISDEGLYGAPVRVLKRSGDMVYILSHYGYAGWAESKDLLPVEETDLHAWLEGDLRVVTARCLDVVSEPTVRGIPLLTLPAGCLLAADPEKCPAGWGRVKLADGRSGYVTACHLGEKRFTEDYLWEAAAPILDTLAQVGEQKYTAVGGRKDFSLQQVLDTCFHGSEAAFRKALTDTAMEYLGVQYRWGGRSSYGIDCSGLVSMSYLRCGITIYRDASIVDGFAMKRLPLKWDTDGHWIPSELEKLLPGDALYFPGHIAMYLGEGRYIHSTGKAGDNGVVINSLIPGDPCYREDLIGRLYAAGGVRVMD